MANNRRQPENVARGGTLSNGKNFFTVTGIDPAIIGRVRSDAISQRRSFSGQVKYILDCHYKTQPDQPHVDNDGAG